MDKRNCLTCGKEFEKNPCTSRKNWNERYKFCSKKCKRYTQETKDKISKNRKGLTAGENHPMWNPLSKRHSTEITTCQCGCGKEFKKYDSKGRLRRFFNFYHKPKGYKRPPYSQEWKDNLSKSRLGKHSGKNHWNWKGGVTRENHRRETNEYCEWRKQVYERDHWTCQKCKIKQNEPIAHHPKGWLDYPELRYEMANGITLCRKCHINLHRNVKTKTKT